MIQCAMAAEPALLAALHKQVQWCDQLNAPFTARVIETMADDWRAGGPLRTLLPDWPGDPAADAVPLRLAGALHGLALSGRHPALAALYPPHATALDGARLLPLLHGVLQHEAGHFRTYLASAPQTNEPLRSAALLGGYAAIARRFGLPLALREIGASAGLNLLWDGFGYRLQTGTHTTAWGDAHSPVQLAAEWRGALPQLPAHIDVAERRGCDRAPLDVHDPAAAARLASYVWPEQRERLERLWAAIALAQRSDMRVETADAGDWIEHELAAPSQGRCTVVVHSIVWQYLPAATQHRLRRNIAEAGARASASAPLAWLRLEPTAAATAPTLRLTCWPGGDRQELASAHAHCSWVEWLPAGGAPPAGALLR
jgi:hypothetical protein